MTTKIAVKIPMDKPVSWLFFTY